MSKLEEKREEDFQDIFEISSMDFFRREDKENQVSSGSEIWTPFLKDGELSADIDIKLLMYYKDPLRSFFELPQIYLNNNIANESKLFFVNPTFTDWSNNIFSSLYCWIKRSNDPLVTRHKEIFAIKSRYYCLVQIIDDQQTPENNGKIKIMKVSHALGAKIKEKSDELLKERTKKQEELEHYRELAKKDKSIDFEKERERILKDIDIINSNDPFRIIDGRIFRIKMRKKTAESFTQYDTSEFRDNRVSLMINGKDCKDKETIYNYLKEHSPDLSKYTWNGYTSEDKKFICRMLIDFFPSDSDVLRNMRSAFPDVMAYENEFYGGNAIKSHNKTSEEKPQVKSNEKKETKKESVSSSKPEMFQEESDSDSIVDNDEDPFDGIEDDFDDLEDIDFDLED